MKKLCGEKTLCKHMADRLQDSGAKGFVVWHLVNIETLKPSRSVVGYKKDTRDKGLALNVCPFCEGPLWKRHSENTLFGSPLEMATLRKQKRTPSAKLIEAINKVVIMGMGAKAYTSDFTTEANGILRQALAEYNGDSQE